ncbi:MAG: UpxY family transcription antiterminator [Mangrovibacterium sp.]
MDSEKGDNQACWYAMRDLKRSNAKLPAYKLFQAKEIEVFTPMKWTVSTQKGKQVRKEIPVMPDLLFVHASREVIDPIVRKTPTIQYRYARGGGYLNPMTVNTKEMQRFIYAINGSHNQKYYLPEEITPEMCCRKIRVVGGVFDGYEGKLITVRGSKVKRLLVELPGFLSVGVEVEPEMIELI